MPKIFTVSDASSVIRSKLSFSKEKGLILMANSCMLKPSSLLIDVYEMHKDKEDGFLYL